MEEKLIESVRVRKIVYDTSDENYLKTNLKTDTWVEVAKEAGVQNGKETVLPACVEEGAGISRTFRILYRNEEITLGDIILFRVHILVDSYKIEETIDQANFNLMVELWFTDQTFVVGRQTTITCVSTRTLQLNFSCTNGLHYHLPVIFDYFHLSAVTLTIHAMLIALHQPYIKKSLLNYVNSCTSRSGKPWIGGSSQRFNLWLPQTAVETFFPVHLSGSSTKCVGSNGMQLSHIKHTHKEVCALLLGSYESLKKTVLQYIKLLPPWQRQKMKTTDCIQEILSASDVEKADDNEEEIVARANSDIAQLCTENILIWQQFLDAFSHKQSIHQHLAKQHHYLRVKRFAEAFFVLDNPRQSASGCYDQNYQNYMTVSEMVRRSRYWAALPSLPVHCMELDGNLSTLPIIFEDQYQDIREFARRRSVARCRKSESDSYLNSSSLNEVQLSDINLQDSSVAGNHQDCSCGIAEILKSRSFIKSDYSNKTGQSKLYYNTDGEDHTPSNKNTEDTFSLQARYSRSLEYLIKTSQPNNSIFTFPLKCSHKITKCCHENNIQQSYKHSNVDSYTLPTRGIKKNFNNYFANNNCINTLPSTRKIKHKNEISLETGYSGDICVKNCTNSVNQKCINNFYSSQAKNVINKDQHCAQCSGNRNLRNIILIKNGDIKLESADGYLRDLLTKSPEKNQLTVLTSTNTSDYRNDECKVAENNIFIRKGDAWLQKSNYTNKNGILNGKRCGAVGTYKVPIHSNNKTQINETSSSDSCGSSFIPGCAKLKAISSSMPFIVQKVEKSLSPLQHSNSSSSMPEFIPDSGLGSCNSKSMPNISANSVTSALMLQKDTQNISSLSDSDITSEQSGWVSSGCSSLDSSTDNITPTGSGLENQKMSHTTINGDILKAKLEKLAQKQKQKHGKQKSAYERRTHSDATFERRNMEPQVSARNKVINTTCEPTKCLERENFKPYNKVDVLPPNQFQDVPPPPPEPFRDDPTRSIDNLLYYMYKTVKDLDTEQKKIDKQEIRGNVENTESRIIKEKFGTTNGKKYARHKKPLHEKITKEECCYCTDENIFTGKAMLYKTDDSDANFKKYKEEFKEEINFTGTLYSEFPTLASTLPYFHISDEYRMFSPEGLHLIICVHGLDGNSADLRLVKTYIELGLPGANLEFLMSERNQGDTFSDFDTMTDRLVLEILYHIDTCGLNPTKISFVGHSLGNIIIRAAITRPQLKHLLPRLHTFLSLSGPHLGTLYNSSGLINMGLWFMQKLKKSGTLLQLSLRDSSDIRKTFLYRLSQHCHLSHFQNILLFGSSQDRYVPLHSARIELCKAAIKDNSVTGAAYREMTHNIIQPIINKAEITFIRYDVHHVLPNTANSLIGRAAHIALLDSDLFIEKFLVVTGLKYFR